MNCAGHHNYKYFVLFLFYTVLLCIFVGLSVLPTVISSWRVCVFSHDNLSDDVLRL